MVGWRPRRDVGESKPVVTLGLPVFNGARYLPETLESLLGQTFGDFDLVICDNASDDGTEAICRRYAASDRRVRYSRSPVNVGAARNFNRTVVGARGRYFKWAAHDDVIHPDYLAECVGVLDSHPDVVWCQSRVGFIGPDGEELASGMGDGWLGMSYVQDMGGMGQDGRVPTRASKRPDERFRAVLLETVGGGNWDVFGLCRTAVLAETGLQRSFYGADKVVVAELALRGRFNEIPSKLFWVRLHGSASAALESAQAQQDWIDPARSSRIASARLGLLTAYLEIVRQAPLSRREKARCLAVVGAYLCQVQKWRRVLRSEVSQQGTGRGLHDYEARTSGNAGP